MVHRRVASLGFVVLLAFVGPVGEMGPASAAPTSPTGNPRLLGQELAVPEGCHLKRDDGINALDCADSWFRWSRVPPDILKDASQREILDSVVDALPLEAPYSTSTERVACTILGKEHQCILYTFAQPEGWMRYVGFVVGFGQGRTIGGCGYLGPATRSVPLACSTVMEMPAW